LVLKTKEIKMSAPVLALTSERLSSLPRVIVERRIFVGDDKEVFVNEWLKSFAEAYRRGRIEGYVLDLTGGRLWAALDSSGVSKEVYNDIALRAVETDDAKAVHALARLTSTCNPITAVNRLTRAFDSERWPNLAETCTAFTRRTPPLEGIGKLLRAESERLELDRNRRPEFRSRVSMIVEAYPGYAYWDRDLVLRADRYHWPPWAVECVPSLHIPVGREDQTKTALVWHYILACLPKSYEYKVLAELCGGHILEVRMSQQASSFVQLIAPTFEQRRLGNPYASDRSTIGVVTDTMSELELAAVARNDLEAAGAFSEARRRILQGEGVLEPNIEKIGEALRKIAACLEPEQNREPEFLTLSTAAVEVYPELDLERRAEEWKLDPWAAECLRKAA
jgi:hypothetical protein